MLLQVRATLVVCAIAGTVSRSVWQGFELVQIVYSI